MHTYMYIHIYNHDYGGRRPEVQGVRGTACRRAGVLACLSLGGSWGAPGGSWGLLGAPGELLGVPGDLLGAPEDLLGAPGTCPGSSRGPSGKIFNPSLVDFGNDTGPKGALVGTVAGLPLAVGYMNILRNKIYMDIYVYIYIYLYICIYVSTYTCFIYI